MSAPVFYSSADVGAPVAGVGASALRDILMACLVTGYGDQPAAGWTVVFDDWVGSGNLSLTNAAGSGVLGLYTDDVPGLYGPLLYVAEGMQSASVAINGNSCGTAITDTTGLSMTALDNAAHFANYYRSVDGMDWRVVANDQAAIIVLERSPQTDYGYLEGNPQPSFSARTYTPDLIFVGALNTHHDWGRGATAALGNFVVMGGGRRRSTNGNSYSSGSISVSAARDVAGEVMSSAGYGLISPMGLMSQPPAGYVDAELRPWRLYVSGVGGGTYSDRPQWGAVPGALGLAEVGHFGAEHWSQLNPGVNAFEGVISVAGRNCIYGVMGSGTPVYISLDVGDWQ